MPAETHRARPLPVEDRRTLILDAAIPLLLEHGNEVTTRQIAEACGIAEGTIFRAFTDKAELIDAALTRFMDPTQLQEALAGIDPASVIEERMHSLVRILIDRHTGIMGMMVAMGMHPRPAAGDAREKLLVLLAGVLEKDADSLRVDSLTAARVIRMMAFFTSIETLHADESLSIDRMVDLLLHGILKKEG